RSALAERRDSTTALELFGARFASAPCWLCARFASAPCWLCARFASARAELRAFPSVGATRPRCPVEGERSARRSLGGTNFTLSELASARSSANGEVSPPARGRSGEGWPSRPRRPTPNSPNPSRERKGNRTSSRDRSFGARPQEAPRHSGSALNRGYGRRDKAA